MPLLVFIFVSSAKQKKTNEFDAVSFFWLHRSTGCVLIYFTEEILPESGFLCFDSRDRDAVTTQFSSCLEGGDLLVPGIRWISIRYFLSST